MGIFYMLSRPKIKIICIGKNVYFDKGRIFYGFCILALVYNISYKLLHVKVRILRSMMDTQNVKVKLFGRREQK